MIGDSNQPPPPEARRQGRNVDWQHLYASEIISMPDKWEYPWFAAWDLAFHCIPLAMIDAVFGENTRLQDDEHFRDYLQFHEFFHGDTGRGLVAWLLMPRKPGDEKMNTEEHRLRVLAGDVGGTKTRLAVFDVQGTCLDTVKEHSYPSGSYNGLEEIVREFLDGTGSECRHACFGIAGPVQRGRVQTTNLPWVVEEEALAALFGFERVALINDLEANPLCQDRCRLSSRAFV